MHLQIRTYPQRTSSTQGGNALPVNGVVQQRPSSHEKIAVMLQAINQLFDKGARSHTMATRLLVEANMLVGVTLPQAECSTLSLVRGHYCGGPRGSHPQPKADSHPGACWHLLGVVMSWRELFLPH